MAPTMSERGPEMTDLVSSAARSRLAEVLATRGGRAEPKAPFLIEHREALIDRPLGITAIPCAAGIRPISVTSAKGRLGSIRPSWLSNVAWSQ